MSEISVFRPNGDYERQRWDFTISAGYGNGGTVLLVLSRYSIERRKHRERFSGAALADRWNSSDERKYASWLPRPTEIPADVLAEAARSIKVQPQIGWTNAASEYGAPFLIGDAQP